jgi:hypothetical protein
MILERGPVPIDFARELVEEALAIRFEKLEPLPVTTLARAKWPS